MVNKSDLRISNFNNKKKINAMIHVMLSYINGEISVHSLLIKFTNMSHPNNNIRNCLTLKEKYHAIELHSSGKSCAKIALELKCGKTQIQKLVKRKADVLEEYENNNIGDKKRIKLKATGNEEINNLVWKFFRDCSARHFKITGPMLQEKALIIAKELGNDTFSASNG